MKQRERRGAKREQMEVRGKLSGSHPLRVKAKGKSNRVKEKELTRSSVLQTKSSKRLSVQILIEDFGLIASDVSPSVLWNGRQRSRVQPCWPVCVVWA